jgi:hypothetical protein
METSMRTDNIDHGDFLRVVQKKLWADLGLEPEGGKLQYRHLLLASPVQVLFVEIELINRILYTADNTGLAVIFKTWAVE